MVHLKRLKQSKSPEKRHTNEGETGGVWSYEVDLGLAKEHCFLYLCPIVRFPLSQKSKYLLKWGVWVRFRMEFL